MRRLSTLLAAAILAAALGAPAGAATTIVAGVQPFTAVTHQFITSLSSAGAYTAAQPAFTDVSGTVAASQLPNPSATTLGGTESITCAANQFVNVISTSGVPSCALAGAVDFTETTKTAAYTTSNTDTGTHFNNAGAVGAVTITAPTTPTVGENHCFLVDAAQTFEFLANTGQAISLGGTTGASAGNVQSSTQGSEICLHAETTTAWRAYSATGTWQVN